MIRCNRCGYEKAVQGLSEIWCDKCDGKRVGPVDLSTVNPIVDRRDLFERADAESYDSKLNMADFLESEINNEFPALRFEVWPTDDDNWRVRVCDSKSVSPSLFLSCRNTSLEAVIDVAEYAFTRMYPDDDCYTFRKSVCVILRHYYKNR